MKEQLVASLRERQITELVEDVKIHAREIFGKPVFRIKVRGAAAASPR
jgi:hypothetical protein